MRPLLSLWVLLYVLVTNAVSGVSIRNGHKKRCRSTDDLGRIPWFLPNSTFHNLGFPLIRTLCGAIKQTNPSYEKIGCGQASSMSYLYESEHDLRSGPSSSTIIVDPHMMQGLDVASSGSYVIMSMFEILHELGYQPGVRHWSEGMNNMFPEHVAQAAMKLSRQYDASLRGNGANPFATAASVIMFQIEVPFASHATVPVNTSPYDRTFQWMIGLQRPHLNPMYLKSDQTSHCTGANFFLGNGHACSTSGVIPCPQYTFHRTRSLEVTPETRNLTKKNIIIFDEDQEEIDMERLKTDVIALGGLDDLQVFKNQGRKRVEMPDFYKTVKMSMDCHNPGVEFINYEATLYDVMTLSCDMRATRNVFDFPVPSKYHIDPQNWTELVHLVHDSMIHYEQKINDFQHFKQLSRRSSEMTKIQLDIHFSSRDVMFRTHCKSYAECRRVYPWAVTVWALYPMAMIEVITDLNLWQESLENDILRTTAAKLFTSKYFKMYNSVPGVAPVDMFPRTPCAYMVYMDASFIPFGRDFLNTHVAALVKDPRPIVYLRGDKIAIAVMHARPYLRVFWFGGKVETTYIESNYLIRSVPNSDTIQALKGVFGISENGDAAYLARFASGEPFLQGHFTEMLSNNPPLQGQPCDDSVAIEKVAEPTISNNGNNAGATAATPASSDAASVSSLRRRVTSISANNGYKPSHAAIARAPQAARVQHSVSPRFSHDTTPAGSPQLHQRHQNKPTFGTLRPHCIPPKNLIIDAMYIPMPIVGDNTHNSVDLEPTLWLTSSTPRLSFKTVFDTLDKKQIETIVQHLDPIVQNSYMRKIVSIIPSDIADALKVFDAADYPNVISLRDMEYPHWGEKCAKV